MDSKTKKRMWAQFEEITDEELPPDSVLLELLEGATPEVMKGIRHVYRLHERLLELGEAGGMH